MINENLKSNNSKLAKIIVNYAFVATFISIYFLNNNKAISAYTTTRVVNLIMTMVLLVLLTFYVIDKMKLPLKTYLLLFLTIGISLAVLLMRQYIIFHWIYLATIVLLVKENVEINYKIKTMIIYLSFILVLYQLYSLRFLGEIPVLSWTDPNYSAYYIFILSIFSKKCGHKKLSMILLLLGFLTLSRTYILAVVIFVLFENSSYLRNLIFRFKMGGFFRLMGASLIIVLVIGSLFLAKKQDVIHFTERGIERLIQVDDLSNLHRFRANEKFIESIISNPTYYLFGVDTADYQQDVFMNTPHNAFLALIVNYGLLFFIPFISLYGMSFNKLFNRQNMSFIMSQFIFYSFLGAGIQGFPGLLLFFTLMERPNNYREKTLNSNKKLRLYM